MKKKIALSLSLFLVALVFVTIFSYTTSPLYYLNGLTPDSIIFQIIGKYWAQNNIPYKDLWDMKGPYIYFINAIGYHLTDSRTGIYVIQIILMWLTLLSAYYICRQEVAPRQSYFIILLSLASLSYIYEGGNLTEEYILFPLTLSFYYVFRWINQYESDHIVNHLPHHSIVYGIVLGLSLMTRLTNALSICTAVCVIMAVLIYHKKFKNIILNALYFLLGFIITTIPFFLYFYHQQALDEMWKATFLFPLKYAGNTYMDITNIGIHYFILSYFSSILLMLLVIFLIVKWRIITLRYILYFFVAFIPFIWFCQGNGYGHYGMTVYPLLLLAILIIKKMRMQYAYYIVSIILLIGCTSKLLFVTKINDMHNQEIEDCHLFLKSNTHIDYSSFIAYECLPDVYLTENIRPSVPIFSLQEMGKTRIPEWNQYVITKFSQYKPKWILVKEDEYVQNIMIKPLLNKQYILENFDSNKRLKLYKRKKEYWN
jgi:hypothetical protein